MKAPLVFISYSHDSPAHKQWVLQLATRLRASGVDAILDQWELGPGSDLPHFMEQSLARADRVLMICTERYVEKANEGKGGVGYEKMIVTADLLKTIDSARVIPIIRQEGIPTTPTFLKTKLYIDLSSDDVFETGMDQLLRELLGMPLFVKPELGSNPLVVAPEPAEPALPDPLTRLLIVIASHYHMSTATGYLPNEKLAKAIGTSKLLFDFALDRAEEKGLLRKTPNGEHVRITDAGRLELVKFVKQ